MSSTAGLRVGSRTLDFGDGPGPPLPRRHHAPDITDLGDLLGHVGSKTCCWNLLSGFLDFTLLI